MSNRSYNKANWEKKYQQNASKTRNIFLRHFYTHAFSDIKTPLKDVPFVALDFETTGLNGEVDDIVSVGLVPFSLERVFCKQSKHWVVQPRKSLSEESIVIHGITHSEVDEAPDLASILGPLLNALSGKIVVVHYAAIERHFLNNALLARISEGIEFALVDTMEIERKALHARQGLLGRLFKSKLGSVRLNDCRKRYSLPAYHNHNALIDALATAELLMAQIQYHYRSDTTLSEILS
ncbi:MAG: 3'-5' exonuclease [Pseudoalteromonas sp.]|uniref:3'-5' exonuclease n=1 Tax=unclassified Pseudoalteromonas TaxID=194690 RepID=UPI0007322254|nr:3'-5' exonuclease [Pseudoalteromonas sp. H103]KTF12102.1 DNA polymerase III subunit epsilon [Pseudoalteromonas sp. H103]